MSYAPIDIIYSSLLTNVLGSVGVLVGCCLIFPLIFFIAMRIPPFFTFICMTPAIYGFGQAGLIPQWVGAMVFVILGIVWAVVSRAIMQDR